MKFNLTNESDYKLFESELYSNFWITEIAKNNDIIELESEIKDEIRNEIIKYIKENITNEIEIIIISGYYLRIKIR